MNLLELFVKLGIDDSEYKKGIADAESDATSKGGKIATALGVVGKTVAAGVAVATGAVAALTKQSVAAYAEQEQLIGGVETLFGDSAKKVLEDASNAFMTAGMSMNQYMETSIQSAASLINSLDGDQAKAAELMNVSVTDMADNVNRMGTSMEAVQNAYRGFSRQNYTMLDNLALGFAGTKEGMQELLDKAQEFSGIEYDISNYADIVEAIHVVQTEMGIAGTTAKEASGTIQGSFGALKSAWDNLVVGISSPDADLGSLIDNVVQSASTAGQNVLPVVERALTGVSALIEELLPPIAERIPEIVTEVLPGLIEAGAKAVIALADGFLTNAPMLLQSGIDLMVRLADGLIKGLPQAIPKIVQTITQLITIFAQNIDKVIEVGVQLILALVDGLIRSIPVLIQSLPTIITAIVDGLLNSIDLIIDAGIELLMALIDAIPYVTEALIQALPDILNALFDAVIKAYPRLFDAAVKLFFAIVDAFPKAWKNLLNALKDGAKAIANYLVEFGPTLYDKAVKMLEGLWKSMGEAVSKAKQKMADIGTAMFNTISGFASKMLSIGRNIVSGIWEGISATTAWIKDKITGWVGNVVDFIKGLFGIHSPSTVMRDEVGKWLGLGVWEGWSDIDPIKMINSEIDGLQTSMNVSASSNMYGTNKGIIDYDRLAGAITDSLVGANLGISIDNDDFGRIVRRVVRYG